MKYWFSYKDKETKEIYIHEWEEYKNKKQIISDIYGNGGIPRIIISEKELNEKYNGNLDFAIQCIGEKKYR